MENYLLDGRCSISSNLAENIDRLYAVGRKNFLFHDTVKGNVKIIEMLFLQLHLSSLQNLSVSHKMSSAKVIVA